MGPSPAFLGHAAVDRKISFVNYAPDPEMPAPDYVPLVGCIGIQSKSAREEISSVSPLWEVCWGLLKGADQSKNWMGFLDPEALNGCLSKDPRWRLHGCAVAKV